MNRLMLSFPGPGLYLADIPLLVIFTASDWFNVRPAEIFNRFPGIGRGTLDFANPARIGFILLI